MNWKVLKTEGDYNKASIRLMEIFNAEPKTPEGDELDLLIVLVKDYDEMSMIPSLWYTNQDDYFHANSM